MASFFVTYQKIIYFFAISITPPKLNIPPIKYRINKQNLSPILKLIVII